MCLVIKVDKNIGKKYNKLKVIKFDHTGKYYSKYYMFECECGRRKVINLQNVKTGKTKSCGCNYKKTGFQKKYNKYIDKGNFVIGYATNTNVEFYIDKDDYEKIKNISWYEVKNGYMCHKEKNKKVILMHRFIMNANEGKLIDHINHNKKDNRKCNLRFVNYKENALNKKEKPKGICKYKVGNNYYYIVQLNGYRGCFKDYKKAEELKNKILKTEYNYLD